MKNRIKFILTIPLLLIFIWSSSKVLVYIKEGIENENLMKDLGVELSLQNPSDVNSPVEFIRDIMDDRKKAVKTLQEKNSDVIGWIYIYDTKIDYPILQSKDNSYYLNHDVEKNYSKYGSIFMDYRNNSSNIDITNNNNMIIYGHKMKNKQMFGSLEYFSDKEYFNSKYPIGIILNDKEYYYEAFSSYITSSDDNYIQTTFNNNDEYIAFIEKIYNKSHTSSIVDLKSIKSILTLSTCSYEYKDARLVVHAKLMED